MLERGSNCEAVPQKHSADSKLVYAFTSDRKVWIKMNIIGYVLYVLALVITVAVIAAKYFGVVLPPAVAFVMNDPARSLLIALALSLVSKWL